jgi:two-component system nitrogen regulation response regulator NtrX
MKHNILLIDDDPAILKSLSGFLNDEGFYIKAVQSGSEGAALIRQKTIPFSLALIDYHMPHMSGVETIKEIRRHNKEIVILAFSGDDSIEAHNESLDSGAIFFVSKDTADAKLLGIIHRVCREVERKIKPLVVSTKSENFRFLETLGIVGVSDKMFDVGKLIIKYAATDETVLIRGENGTGKELIAKAIHQNSQRKTQKFIAINAGAIPENLVESELFGHEKGAFTGATHDKIGKFQAAQGGTIFLDEIGDMPFHLQVKLLRVIQERVITPVGSNATKKIDVRIIAATNAPLEDLIKEKQFREDLYYRLNVLPLNVPSLRERPEDIPYLVNLFLDEANKRNGTHFQILESAMENLSKLHWAGNVRELQSEISRLASLSDGPYLNIELLSSESNRKNRDLKKSDKLDVLKSKVTLTEKQIIESAIKKYFTVAAAARALNMKRTTLRDKIKKYGIILLRDNSAIEEEEIYG